MTDDPRNQGRKPGFLSRLFGRGRDAEPAPAPAPEADVVTPDGLALLPTADPLAAALASPPPSAPPASEPEAEAPPAPPPQASAPEIAAAPPVEAAQPPPSEPLPASVPALPAAFTLVAPLAPQPAPASAPALPESPAKSWWTRLSGGLARTSSQLTTGITDLFTKRKLDAATLDDLEDILIQSDLGLEAAARIGKAVGSARYEKGISGDEVRAILAREVGAILAPVARPLVLDRAKKPFVILMTGVNGAGKTTTIGKLAAKFRSEGLTVTLAAGDTFRAAAIEQLKVWGQRTGAAVIAREQGSDAASLAFDALTEAKASGADVLLVDTAGRLQNKAELMAELAKVTRVLKKVDPEAPHAALLVLDATVGQNAISQVEAFQGAAGLTGLVMTKLDGTARGGILVALASKFSLPVHFIGVGEGVEDLEPFDATDFARAVAGLEKAP